MAKTAAQNEEVKTTFYVKEKKPLRLKCHHCEKTTSQEEIVLK